MRTTDLKKKNKKNKKNKKTKNKKKKKKNKQTNKKRSQLDFLSEKQPVFGFVVSDSNPRGF